MYINVVISETKNEKYFACFYSVQSDVTFLFSFVGLFIQNASSHSLRLMNYFAIISYSPLYIRYKLIKFSAGCVI